MNDAASAATAAGIKQQHQSYQILKVLEAFKEAIHQLKSQSHTSNPSIKALLDLETESNFLISSNPFLSSLSTHLSDLKNLIHNQENSKPAGIKSYVVHKIRAHEISRVCRLIESDIQSWIDRETLNDLLNTLEAWSESGNSNSSSEEEILLEKLSQLRNRVSQGFDLELQGMLLKSRIVSKLESLILSSDNSKRVRELSAYCLKELVLFNKDVFVGQVLVGQTIIKALVSMGSLCALEVLKSLIKAIKSPLVDEVEAIGGILKVVNTLHSRDLDIKIRGLDCIMEIGYYGRKEAIEAVLAAGLIQKLVDLQRTEFGGDLEGKINPFASCVARFALQLEIGEGLRQREKRAFKQEILKRIREASGSDAEAATIIAEVLWGSSP